MTINNNPVLYFCALHQQPGEQLQINSTKTNKKQNCYNQGETSGPHGKRRLISTRLHYAKSQKTSSYSSP
jgi:hypothetical protein